jgi:predicted transcriptional regulator
LQRQIVFLIHSHCKRIRSEVSPPIAIEHIIETCGTTYHAARKAIQRLEQKGIVLRAEFKSGRSGWTKYELPNDVFQEMMQNEFEAKPRPIRGQTEAKPGTEVETEPRPKLSSSSGSNLDLRATRTSEAESALPTEWAAIDVTQLATIGFTQTHVRQIYRAGLLTPEELQDSIDAFAFDLEVNGKAKALTGPPLNFFMGCLRRGPYAPAENYEAPEVRQRRLYLEAKEKQAKARRELEDKIELLEFEEWSSKLSLEERTQLVPTSEFAKVGSTAHTIELRRHFREVVWPGRRLQSKELTRE